MKCHIVDKVFSSKHFYRFTAFFLKSLILSLLKINKKKLINLIK